MIHAKSSGSTKKTEAALEFMKSGRAYEILDRAGRLGVDALSNTTPVDTGLAAASWGYQIGYTGGKRSVSWYNTDKEGGVNVAVILQYGHGTGTGGYVVGRDYINPAMRPIFERTIEEVWRQVRNA